MTNEVRSPRDFTLTWTLDAPPAKVFQAWTDPDHLDWFYNDDQPKPSEPIELVGGAWRQRMLIDESTAYVTGGVYREIVRSSCSPGARPTAGRSSISIGSTTARRSP